MDQQAILWILLFLGMGIILSIVGFAGAWLGRYVKQKTEFDWMDNVIVDIVFWIEAHQDEIGKGNEKLRAALKKFTEAFIAEYNKKPSPSKLNRAEFKIEKEVKYLLPKNV